MSNFKHLSLLLNFCINFFFTVTSSCLVRAVSPSVRASFSSLDTQSSSRQICSPKKWPTIIIADYSHLQETQRADICLHLLFKSTCTLWNPPRARPLACRLTLWSCGPRRPLSSPRASSTHWACVHQPCRTPSHTNCSAGAAGCGFERPELTPPSDHSLRTARGETRWQQKHLIRRWWWVM